MQSLSVLAVLALAFSCTLALDVTLNQHWKLWKEANNKRYTDAEEHVRRATWENNLKKVQEHNLQADLGVHTYWLGMNKYADLTVTEFVKVMNGYNVTMRGERTQHRHTFTANPDRDVPDTVDWRDKGYVTGVKDQGQCGSCWAFSATGAIEGAWFVAKNQLVSVAEQQLVDCAGSQGNQGCNGGLMDFAFQYVIKNKGIGSEASYKYTARDGSCKKVPSVVTIAKFVDTQKGSESALAAAIQKQPVAIAIEADQSCFQLYHGGILDDASCGRQLDHGVLAVGLGTDSASGKDYWRVKNSWGASWGDNGYISMVYGKNQCGLAAEPSYPVA